MRMLLGRRCFWQAKLGEFFAFFVLFYLFEMQSSFLDGNDSSRLTNV